MASVAKDFHRLMKRVGKLTDGQATISDIDWDAGNLQRFNVILRPNSGLYKNGTFKFEIKLVNDYPEIPPVVWCHTDIYHPNIDPSEDCFSEASTNVCLNLLENGVWSQSFGLEGTVLGLLFLMHNPNIDDPLSPYFEGTDNFETYRENVSKYMADEQIDDFNFAKDFCVKDGVLVEELKHAASAETDINECSATKYDMSDAHIIEHNKWDESLVTTKADDINSNEINEASKPQNSDTHTNNKTSAGINTEIDSREHHTHAIDNHEQTDALLLPEYVTSDENNDKVNNANGTTENGEKQQCMDSNSNVEQTAETLDDVIGEGSDDDNECEFELVSIDGECMLLMRNSGDNDMNMQEQGPDINTNDAISVICNISVSVDEESTNEIRASAWDSVDTKPESSYIERISQADINIVHETEGSMGVHTTSEQTVMIQNVPDAAYNNVSNLSKSIACGLLAAVTYGLYKIVRRVVH